MSVPSEKNGEGTDLCFSTLSICRSLSVMFAHNTWNTAIYVLFRYKGCTLHKSISGDHKFWKWEFKGLLTCFSQKSATTGPKPIRSDMPCIPFEATFTVF